MNAQDIDVTVHEHSQTRPKGKFTPGDSPNKQNAKRRKDNRPKTPNMPQGAGPKQDERMVWYDPTPTVDALPVYHDLQSQQVAAPAGYVALRNDLPAVIAQPFADTFSSVIARTNLSPALVDGCIKAIKASSYFKAARQLYSTLADPSKSQLQPLKAVFYDTAPIPKRLGTALSIIGTMDTKLGSVEVQDGPLLFKRWVCQGLIESGLIPTSSLTVGPHEVVWRDQASKDLINRVGLARLMELCSVPYRIVIPSAGDAPSQQIQVRPIVPTLDAGGYHRVDHNNVNSDKIKRVVALLALSDLDYIAGENPQLGDGDIDACLAEIGLVQAPEEFTDHMLRIRVEKFNGDYLTKYRMHIDCVFDMADGPSSGHGLLAQMVSSEDVTAEFPFPMSDADKQFGFMFGPSKGVELNPRYLAYSKVTKNHRVADYVARDLKSFAK